MNKRKRALFFLVCMVSVLFIFSSTAGAQTPVDTTGQANGVSRLYQGFFERQPDQPGLDYWVKEMQWDRRPEEMSLKTWVDTVQAPPDLDEIAELFMQSDEFSMVLSAPSNEAFISLVYEHVFRREADAAGAAYWTSLLDSAKLSKAQLMVELTSSQEFMDITGIGMYTPSPHWSLFESGFIDTGNGIGVPQILLNIRYCESKGNYFAQNKISSASGAYQFLDDSWEDYGHDSRFNVEKAVLAKTYEQDYAALITYIRSGSAPWYPSRSCWSGM